MRFLLSTFPPCCSSSTLTVLSCLRCYSLTLGSLVSSEISIVTLSKLSKSSLLRYTPSGNSWSFQVNIRPLAVDLDLRITSCVIILS